MDISSDATRSCRIINPTKQSDDAMHATAVRVTQCSPAIATMEHRASSATQLLCRQRKREPVKRHRYRRPHHIQQNAHRPASSSLLSLRTKSANSPDRTRTGSPLASPAPNRQNGFADSLRLASGADCVSDFWETRLESSRAEVQQARELVSRYPIAAKPPLAPLKHENFPDRGTQRKPPAPSDLLA